MKMLRPGRGAAEAATRPGCRAVKCCRMAAPGRKLKAERLAVPSSARNRALRLCPQDRAASPRGIAGMKAIMRIDALIRLCGTHHRTAKTP